MKVFIGYPPLDTSKGVALLSQNRQFQYFKKPTYIYPVVPAQAATLLKKAGFEVIWKDCIAEGWTKEQFYQFISKEKPDLVAFETKTPVVQEHWEIINYLNRLSTIDHRPLIVLFGDHVTALPEESFQNSQVDYVLTGGDYDFLLLNLCSILNESKLSTKLEPGIYYRENGQIKNTGKFQLNHDLDSAPFIDRELTQWQNYAYENGNYRRTPGTYIMSARDCWWAKCTFCLHPDTNILTPKGQIPISELVEYGIDGNNSSVLTHDATFEKITKTFKRYYEGEILNIELYGLKPNLRITSNHKIYSIKRSSIKRCSKKNSSAYLCVPGRKSHRLDCAVCNRTYYKNYTLQFNPSGELTDGDFVATPIMREIKDAGTLDLLEVYKEYPHFVKTTKLKEDSLIDKILSKYKLGLSQRTIAKELGVDRETVNRYIALSKENRIYGNENPIVVCDKYIRFKNGKKWAPRYLPLSKEFMRFVGYYLAEGHVCKIKDRSNAYALVLTFSQKEKDFINDVVAIGSMIFDRLDVRTHVNRKNKTVQIAINSSILAKAFSNLFGSNSYNKKIPDFFMYLPLEKQKEIIRGAFNGDGHLRKRESGKGGTEYIYSTVSALLSQQILMMLLRANKIPRLRICAPGKKATVQSYSLSLSQYDVEDLYPEIKMPVRATTYRHGFVLNDFAMIPIKKMYKERYSGFVYNLEVNKQHTYLANNIVVSNCSWPTMYNKFRSRSVRNVLDEIGELIGKYGVKEIMDDSGSFPAGAWLKDFCDGMIARGYNRKVNLDCNMRFGALSPAEYKLMKRAGFRLMLFGIESANQTTLDRINKNVKVEEIITSCKSARKCGLYPHITIMFGYPWEIYEEALKTLKLGQWLLRKGYAYTMQATVVIPYPGSPLFEECKANNWLKTTDWQSYDMKEPVMTSPVGDDRVMRLVQSLYSVALNPEFIWNRIISISGFEDIAFFMRAFPRVFGHIFDFRHKSIPQFPSPGGRG